MSEPRPAVRITIPIGGVVRDLIPTEKLTLPELKTVKRVSGGMALADFEDGLKKGDGDAWLAWIYVSLLRVQPTLTVQELEQVIGDEPLIGLVEKVEREAPEVAQPDPPDLTSSNGSAATTNDNGSGGKTPEPSTAAISGHPTS